MPDCDSYENVKRPNSYNKSVPVWPTAVLAIGALSFGNSSKAGRR
jgi:hypothetical protein